MQKITKEYSKSGIYCILNLKNQKKYIGSSKNIQERIINHKILLKNNKHYNNILQNSYNKYKKNNFIWFILEFCDDLLNREQFYIDNLNPEFNIIKVVTENNVTGKEIYQYSLSGKFIKKYDYIKQACIENNIHQSTISRYLKGKSGKGGNFLWSLDYKEKLKPYKRKNKDNSYNYKKVKIVYNNNEIKHFKSLKECAKYLNIFPSEVSKAIKTGRKFKNNFIIQFE